MMGLMLRRRRRIALPGPGLRTRHHR